MGNLEDLRTAKELIDRVLANMSAPAPIETPDAFKAALKAATPGSVIKLAPGRTFEGNFVIPPVNELVITCEGRLPEGRVTSASGLPKFISTTNVPALMFSQGARAQILQAVEVEGTEPIRCGSDTETDPTKQPSLMRFVQNYIHAPAAGGKRGLALHGSDCLVSECYISGFALDGQDSQAIGAWNGPGPYTIRNNYLEASGENILFGGSDARIPGLVTAGINIEGNLIAKPMDWFGKPYDVKNLVEIKNGRGVTMKGNVFSGSWKSAQDGYAILLSPRNQNGGNTSVVVRDVTIENNAFINVGSGIKLTGDDDTIDKQPTKGSQRGTDYLIRNNFFRLEAKKYTSDGRMLFVQRGPQEIHVIGNTCISDGSGWIYTTGGGAVEVIQNSSFLSNIAFHRTYGFYGTKAGTVRGNACLTAFYPGAAFEGNVLAGGIPKEYPATNIFPTVAEMDLWVAGEVSPTWATGRGADMSKIPQFA